MSKKIFDIDPWLMPYKNTIEQREQYVKNKIDDVLGDKTVCDFAMGHKYFGLHREEGGWIFREWAPNATKIFLVGDFSNHQELPKFQLQKRENGQWSIRLGEDELKIGQKYKLSVYWQNGHGWRLPSYASYVIQDEATHDFSAVVRDIITPYEWKYATPKADKTPLIYEAHVGMSSEKPAVASFDYFRKNILPRIKKSGYNTVQLMAIPEHPYYGSFGYHVSNFFAVSSRFGTPEEFKRLVDEAHKLNLKIVLDLVHSHAIKNENEGLSRFDGTLNQYFYSGKRGHHPSWDSRLFDYGKAEVLHFLLSNCRYWLDEYNVDGFRFDGVTSMLYSHHGLEKSFTNYDDYFGNDVEKDVLVYLRLANELSHDIKPASLTIAEEMSGFPGVAAKIENGGLGFDYRLHMGAPDLWIKTIKEKKDEDWDLGNLYHTLKSHRPEEKTIIYSESHDQALVGDKTLIFRLIDKEMYWHMQKNDPNIQVERGIALHKLIRLFTASLHGGGYLNFMGNEFGHPEWIDFPRADNNWSYKHARRQWSLSDDQALRYEYLSNFDEEITHLITELNSSEITHETIRQQDNVVSFLRNDYLFMFNFSPTKSHNNYSLPARAGSYSVILSSDDNNFGGYERIDKSVKFFTEEKSEHTSIKVYLPARTAIVLKKND